jgi:hypothetical protein
MEKVKSVIDFLAEYVAEYPKIVLIAFVAVVVVGVLF